MKKLLVLALAATACGGMPSTDTSADDLEAAGAHGQPEPTMLGIHYAKGEAGHNASSSPDMTFHGGDIMPVADTYAIWWGTSFANDTSDKIGGIDTWYQGFGGSNYAKTNTEYNGPSGYVSGNTTHHGHLLDTSSSLGHAPNQTKPILNEVCAVLAANGITPSPAGYYAVYTDLPRGHANYCAWHSWGSCNGTNIQFAFFFKLDGDAGCDPQDTSGLHSQGLAALANVSGHELSEFLTDPRGAGWFDSSGAENGDKCAWTFNVPLVKFSNNSQWKIQGEWSNAAFDSNTGYPNRSGQNGCLDGH